MVLLILKPSQFEFKFSTSHELLLNECIQIANNIQERGMP